MTPKCMCAYQEVRNVSFGVVQGIVNFEHMFSSVFIVKVEHVIAGRVSAGNYP